MYFEVWQIRLSTFSLKEMKMNWFFGSEQAFTRLHCLILISPSNLNTLLVKLGDLQLQLVIQTARQHLRRCYLV